MMEPCEQSAVNCDWSETKPGSECTGVVFQDRTDNFTDNWDSDELSVDETVVLLDKRGSPATRGMPRHDTTEATSQDPQTAGGLELVSSESHPGEDGRGDRQGLLRQAGSDHWGLLPVVAACMAALGGVLFGYDAGIVSGALLQLEDEFNLSCLQQELVVSTLMLGAVLASLTGGYLIDYFGRRPTIIINACIFVIGALILALCQRYSVLIVGRFVVGFAVSLSATAECVYISEISPPKRRGFLVSLNELGITLGFLLAYLISYIFINKYNGWRYMFGLSAIPAAIQGLAMVFLPPSPRYLMIKHRQQKAAEVLNRLHGPAGTEAEIDAIKHSIQDEKARTTCDLLRSSDNMRFRMMVALGLVFLQQCTGQPSVLYYAPTVFQAIGFHSNDAATLATVGLGTIKVVSTIVALLSIDKVGRRKFLMFGASLMAISLLCLGILIQSTGHRHAKSLCDDSSAGQNTSYDSTQWTSQSAALSNSQNLVEMTGAQFDALAPSVIRNNSSSSSNSNPGSPTDLVTSAAVVKWGAFISLTVFVSGYALSFGPGSWLILSEIFPSAVKGRAISLATTVNWGTNLVVAFTFLDLMNGIGVGYAFVFYGVISTAAVAFIFCVVPETKGKTLEQISRELNNKTALQRLKDNCRCDQRSCVDSYERVRGRPETPETGT